MTKFLFNSRGTLGIGWVGFCYHKKIHTGFYTFTHESITLVKQGTKAKAVQSKTTNMIKILKQDTETAFFNPATSVKISAI